MDEKTENYMMTHTDDLVEHLNHRDEMNSVRKMLFEINYLCDHDELPSWSSER